MTWAPMNKTASSRPVMGRSHARARPVCAAASRRIAARPAATDWSRWAPRGGVGQTVVEQGREELGVDLDARNAATQGGWNRVTGA